MSRTRFYDKSNPPQHTTDRYEIIQISEGEDDVKKVNEAPKAVDQNCEKGSDEINDDLPVEHAITKENDDCANCESSSENVEKVIDDKQCARTRPRRPKDPSGEDECAETSPKTTKRPDLSVVTFLDPNKLAALEGKAPVSPKPGALCRFKCPTCGHATSGFQALRKHLTRTQHFTGSVMEVTAMLTRAVLHKCSLCQQTLLCDRTYIYSHLWAKHKITYAQYATDHKYTSSAERIREVFESFVKDVPVFPAQPSATATADEVPTESTTSKVGNLCLFACKHCPDRFKSWGHFRDHIRDRHRLKGNTRYDPKQVLVARYHCCVLCQKRLLCDRTFLRNHVKQSPHRISLAQYVEIVREKTGRQNVAFSVKELEQTVF